MPCSIGICLDSCWDGVSRLKSMVGISPRNFIDKCCSVLNFSSEILEFRWINSLCTEPEYTIIKTVQNGLQQGLRDFKNWLQEQLLCRTEPGGANSLHERCSIQITSTGWDLFTSCRRQKSLRLFTKILIFIHPFENQSLINLDQKLKEIFFSNAGWNQLASLDAVFHSHLMQGQWH